MGANNKFKISLLLAAVILSTHAITAGSHKELIKNNSDPRASQTKNRSVRSDVDGVEAESGDTNSVDTAIIETSTPVVPVDVTPELETAISGDAAAPVVEAPEVSVVDVSTDLAADVIADTDTPSVDVTYEQGSTSFVVSEDDSVTDVATDADVISIDVVNEQDSTAQDVLFINKVDTIIAMLRDMQESFDGDINLYQAVCKELEEMLSYFNDNEEIRRNFFETVMHWLTNTDDSLANLQNAYSALQQQYSDSMEEKDAQIVGLQDQLVVVQQNLEQEKISMADVIAQLHDSYNNLQSAYEVLIASNNSDNLALVEPITALSDKYNAMIKERNQSLVFIKNLKEVIKEYFSNDQQDMNYINDKLQQ